MLAYFIFPLMVLNLQSDYSNCFYWSTNTAFTILAHVNIKFIFFQVKQLRPTLAKSKKECLVTIFCWLPLPIMYIQYQGQRNQGASGALPSPNNFDGGLALQVILWLLHVLLGLKRCHVVQLTLNMPSPPIFFLLLPFLYIPFEIIWE